MGLNKKTAQNFVSALTVAQLRRAAVAYAQGVPFENILAELHTTKPGELPEYLRRTRALLCRRKTITDLAEKLNCTKDTAWTYLAKLRKHRVRVHSQRRYGKTVYWVEKDEYEKF